MDTIHRLLAVGKETDTRMNELRKKKIIEEMEEVKEKPKINEKSRRMKSPYKKKIFEREVSLPESLKLGYRKTL